MIPSPTIRYCPVSNGARQGPHCISSIFTIIEIITVGRHYFTLFGSWNAREPRMCEIAGSPRRAEYGSALVSALSTCLLCIHPQPATHVYINALEPAGAAPLHSTEIAYLKARASFGATWLSTGIAHTKVSELDRCWYKVPPPGSERSADEWCALLAQAPA